MVNTHVLTPSLVKNHVVKLNRSIANFFVWGRKNLVEIEKRLDEQKRSLHAIWSNYLPARQQVVTEVQRKWAQHELDVSIIGNKSDNLVHDIELMVKKEIQQLQVIQQTIFDSHRVWDMKEALSEYSKQAQRQAGINIDTGVYFETIFPVPYVAMDTRFAAVSYSILGLLPVWWNLQAEMNFLWKVQKKIYRLEAINRIIWEDQQEKDRLQRQAAHNINLAVHEN